VRFLTLRTDTDSGDLARLGFLLGRQLTLEPRKLSAVDLKLKRSQVMKKSGTTQHRFGCGIARAASLVLACYLSHRS
jgi:hypothetical protein